MSIKGLYIQIPFSNHVCGDVLDFSDSSFYIDLLIEQFQFKQEHYESIYIGGGNLLKLSRINLKKFVNSLPKYDCLSIEINPYYMENLDIFENKESIRICLGVQKEAKHNPYEFNKAIETLRKVGFNNISLEIPYALKNQTLSEYNNILQTIIQSRPDHISIYPEDDDSESFYDLTKILLEQAGYEHYEVTSFCVNGKKSPQTLIYNQYEDYDALGLGAVMKINNKRKVWVENNGSFELETIETLNDSEVFFEKVFMLLHLKEGVPLSLTQDKIDWTIIGIEIVNQHARLESFKHLYFVMSEIDNQLAK